MTRPKFTASLLFNAIAFALVAGLAWTTQAQSQQPNQDQANRQITTLAIVNGAPISRQQVAQECMRRFGEESLEKIINKLLVAQELMATGIAITEKDINDFITQEAAKFNLSANKLIETYCTRRNMSVDQLKNDFFWNRLALQRLAEGKVNVSPEEINERMEFEFGARVQVRQIVVDSAQVAQQVHQAATANPGQFESLAKQYSVDPNSASMGGLMWPIRKNSGLPELEEMAFSLQEGQVSRILPIENNFVILRCEKHIPAQKVSSAELPEIHDRIVEAISQDKLRDVAANLFQELQQKTRIVNVMNDEKLAQQMPGVAAVVNDRQVLINSVAEDCITYFGVDMLETIINNTLLRQEMKRIGVQVEQADIDQEIARAAEAAGYLNDDGSVNINQWLTIRTRGEQDQIQFYVEDEVWPTVALKKLVSQSVQVTEDDIQKGFQANFGPRVEALAIVLQSQRDAQKVWTMAQAVVKDNQQAAAIEQYFGELANQYSTDPMSKNNFGQIPPIQQHGGMPELEQEAFSLKAGEISKLIQRGNSWVILYCKGRTEPVVTDLDAVRDGIHKDILEKKYRLAMKEKFQQLREAAQIDNFLTGTSQPGAAQVQAAREANRIPGNQLRR